MVTVRYSSSRGYILTIADLRRVLADISHGSRRWWIDDNVTLLRDPEKPRSWLTLFHACPAPGQMTDEISFQVPVLLASRTPRNRESALVCLHPEMIRPHMEGLYLENDRVLGDCLEDWHMFWSPLNAALGGALQQIRSNWAVETGRQSSAR
jgi:hypothetical protein